MTLNKFIVTFVIIGGFVTQAWADETASQQEINYLIQAVADSGCDFERNGSRHDAHEAADHLRLKYRRGKKYADSAEHFIDRLASESSFTGKPYRIVCSDSESYLANNWLHEKLKLFRQPPPTPQVKK